MKRARGEHEREREVKRRENGNKRWCFRNSEKGGQRWETNIDRRDLEKESERESVMGGRQNERARNIKDGKK